MRNQKLFLSYRCLWLLVTRTECRGCCYLIYTKNKYKVNSTKLLILYQFGKHNVTRSELCSRFKYYDLRGNISNL